jgi:nitrogen fixation protein NifB
MLLCVSSNGLGIGPHLDELAQLAVSHVTITLNTIRPETAAAIYSWMRIDKRLRNAREGAPVMLERQLAAIRGLKERGLVVKVNCILLPGVNDGEVLEVAETARKLGADLFNLLPYYRTDGCKFAGLAEPDPQLVSRLRKKAGRLLPQMTHCARCRADAVGLLGKDQSDVFREAMESCAAMEAIMPAPVVGNDDSRPFVAVATREGMLVNQHLGEASTLSVFRHDPVSGVGRVDIRPTPPPGGGNRRWLALARSLADCRALVVTNLGDTPKRVLSASGLAVITAEGMIDDIVERVCTAKPMNHLVSRSGGCSTCSGAGKGCGA